MYHATHATPSANNATSSRRSHAAPRSCHDPGINHGILDELQRLGYPILSQSTLPLDEDLLDRLFGDEVRDGRITHPLDILDVWKNASVANTNHKLWAAKVVARHPQLVALELSNFKCGHDAPVYAVIEQIVEESGTPFFAFKDIDENRSLGSIRIRIETIDDFLRRYRERQLPAWRTSAEIDRHLKEYEHTLLTQRDAPQWSQRVAILQRSPSDTESRTSRP